MRSLGTPSLKCVSLLPEQMLVASYLSRPCGHRMRASKNGGAPKQIPIHFDPNKKRAPKKGPPDLGGHHITALWSSAAASQAAQELPFASDCKKPELNEQMILLLVHDLPQGVQALK